MSTDGLTSVDVELAKQSGRVETNNFRYVEDRLIHQGAVVGFYTASIEDHHGERFDRDVVRHPGAVAVVPVHDGHIYLVQQYRAALDADLIEIPAGKRDIAGEPPDVAAGRELEEEIGMRAGAMELLLNIHFSPGFCDEYGYIFLATDLEAVPQRREGPEEQAMQVLKVTVDEAVAMCLEGRITDSKTLAGVMAAAHRLSSS